MQTNLENIHILIYDIEYESKPKLATHNSQ
jgi:hypothetical protein